MTETAATAFQPLLPAWLAATVVLLLALGAAASIRALGLRAAWPRLAVALLAALVLLNPVRREVERAGVRPLGLIVLDESASMALGQRRRQAARAAVALRRSAPGTEWRVVAARPQPGLPTRLAPALAEALATAPADRLAGVALITDGALADEPADFALPAGVPLHHLRAGSRRDRDRRIVLVRTPPYALVGGTARVSLRVEDSSGSDAPVEVEVALDGRPQPPITLRPGVPADLSLQVARRGPFELTLAAAGAPGELTLVNNRALVRIMGVRERLSVLLVSGAPYPGGRVWRDLLKSDGAIDLTHFTILRLPFSFDTTPPSELALIPFPVDQLFGERLAGFDLIIFDRFALPDLITAPNLARVASRVRAGGSLLVVGDADLSQPGGLMTGPLARTLPARLAGPALDSRFTPALTGRGQRHPVTAALRPPWGAWAGQGAVTPAPDAAVLMTGAGGRPLLMLGEAGRGRVALLASTSLWWWAREVEGAGPRDALLRRLAHWLMREPDLEERALTLTARGRTIGIDARDRLPPQSAVLRGPAGEPVRVALASGRAAVPVAGDGLYRVEAAGLSRAVLVGDIAELAEPLARARPLGEVVAATRGGAPWLEDGMPEVRLRDGGAMAGDGWIGLRRPAGGAILSVSTRPLVPAWAGWTALVGAAALAWWRERRGVLRRRA